MNWGFERPVWSFSRGHDDTGNNARSSVTMVEDCLRRIDERESEIRAWVILDREGALREATRQDDERRRGLSRGALHGIPVGVKDLFDVAGWPTRCGLSDELVERYPAFGEPKEHDAPLVADWRAAGAIILGKTVTTPLAWVDPPPTTNPWRSDRTPGGSSSGSAAAVAAGMCLAALGSQTGGSITRPSAYCGVVGWKPSYGQLSLQGVFPLAHPLDHPGVIAGTVEDCLIASSALGGATLSGIEDLPAPRAIACLDDPLMEETAIEYQEAVAEFVRRAARRGITCERKTLDRPIRDYFREFSEILATCASTHLEGAFGSDLSALPSRIQQLAMEGQKLRTSERRATVGPIADRGLDRLRSVAGRELIEPGTVVVCPPAPALPPDRSSTGNPIWNAVWSLLGLPTLTFPMGWTTDGLPVGVQVVARQGEDALLFGAGKWLGG